MSEFKNILTTKDRDDAERIARRLMLGLTNTSPSIHRDLIQCYLEEAIVYARTGKWVLEEAAAKIGQSDEATEC